MKNQKGYTTIEAVLTLSAFVFIATLIVVGLASTLYGLVLAFKASFILGLLVLIFEPTPAVIGIYAFFGHPDIAQKLVTWLHLPTF